MTREEIFELVEKERDRQDQIHPNDYLFDMYAPSILGEEVGEIHKAVVELDDENLRVEIIQTMAVCCRWLELMK